MGLLDDLRRELTKAVEEAQRTAAAGSMPPGPVARPGTPPVGTAGPRALEDDTAFAPTGDLPRPPARRLAVVACMDTRLRVDKLLGLRPGDAHLLRNAGGIVTDDVLRSLLVSYHVLGTRQVYILNHTDCGMMTFRDEDLRATIQQRMGTASPVPVVFGAFRSLEENVRRQMERVRQHPWLPADLVVKGFVCDLKTNRLHEISAEPDSAAAEAADTASPSTQRVGGRLQRENLERIAPGPRAIPQEATAQDYRRKAEAMERGEPAALNAFGLDLAETNSPPAGSSDAPVPFRFAEQDLVRSLILGEMLDEPKGRRARRPHPR